MGYLSCLPLYLIKDDVYGQGVSPDGNETCKTRVVVKDI